MKWHFSRKRPSDKTRDPIASEFFSSDAIKNAGEALIREGIQNSLDARLDRNGLCKIRVYLSGDTGALDPSRHNRWFESAWPHYRAPKNGLRSGAISPDKKCRFLVFEDFLTTGLTGDQEQHDPLEGAKNAFFYFFRAEGKTEKSGDDRGRWGIGKQVFPRSSKAQTFFGYSETDTSSALMGGCILKHHIESGIYYKPDGYFGEIKSVADDELTVPIRDPEVIRQFCADFKVNRKPGETGLSVVVPWLDEGNGDDDPSGQGFTRNAICLAAVSGYFIPILEGRLELAIEDDTGSYKVDRYTYHQILSQIEASSDSKTGQEVTRLRVFLELAEREHTGSSKSFVLPPCPWMKAEWSPDSLAESHASEMRDCLEKGQVIKVSATVTVRPKDAPHSSDSFYCLIAKQSDFCERPAFIREDLIISEVTKKPVTGFVCLVRVDRGPLATLLGDSENPSHTEWQTDSKNFKGKYTYGGLAIEFVSTFAHVLLRKIHATSRQLDRKLLVDLFFDEGEAESSAYSPAPKPIPRPCPVPPVDAPEKPALRIHPLNNGFVLRASGGPLKAGTKVAIEMAYETSKGNALKSYRIYDFDISKGDYAITAQGCEIGECVANRIIAEVNQPDFSLSVTGFDRNRDLYVRPRIILSPTVTGATGEEE